MDIRITYTVKGESHVIICDSSQEAVAFIETNKGRVIIDTVREITKDLDGE